MRAAPVNLLFTGTAETLEKIEALNSAMRRKSCDFLHQKQAEFDQDYVEFKHHIAQIRVSYLMLYSMACCNRWLKMLFVLERRLEKFVFFFCRRSSVQVCIQPSTTAVNVTLLAFAADRRAAVNAPCSNRSISPACWAPSSKPAARCCSGR